MQNKFLKFSLAACVTGISLFATNPDSAMAFEEPIAGFTYDKMYKEKEEDDEDVVSAFSIIDEPISGFTYDKLFNRSGDGMISSLSTIDITIPGFTNIGVANVDTNLLIREKPDSNGKILGKLPKNGGINVVEADSGSGWTKVSSGKITGYVNSEYLVTGPKAASMAIDVGDYIAKANTNNLRVRSKPSVDGDVLDVIAQGEELIVVEDKIVTDGEEHDQWVKVSLDSDTQEGSMGYVAKQYVDLEYSLAKAVTIEELQYGEGVSSVRVELLNYAKKFLGNPYVFGGNSLTNGIDCSGFVKQIYAKFGYTSLARHSGTQAQGGTAITRSELKPADLIFYGSGGTINHVAIYMGDGKIIHASNRRDGIKTSNAFYRTPLKYVRYIND